MQLRMWQPGPIQRQGESNAVMTRAAAFEIVKTNNLPTVSEVGDTDFPTNLRLDYTLTVAVAGHKSAAGSVTLIDLEFESECDVSRQVTDLVAGVAEQLGDDNPPPLVMVDHEGDFVAELQNIIGVPPSAMAITVATISTPPDAPSMCPTALLVDETSRPLRAWSPKTRLIALVSAMSPNTVLVPCALT